MFIFLKEWLLKKEQKELEALQREEEERQASEAAKLERDAKFRERAARQKKKLQAYYASLKRQADIEQSQHRYSSHQAYQAGDMNSEQLPHSAAAATSSEQPFGAYTQESPVLPRKSSNGVDAAKTAAAAYEAYMARAVAAAAESQPPPVGDDEDGNDELAAVDENLEDDEEQEEAAEEEMAVSLPPLQTPPLLTRDKKQAPGSCD